MNYTCKDRFHLTREENLFLAKKLWDESIFCGMKMENRNITFPETKAILNGINVPRVSIDDAYAVCRYRDAWKFVLDTLDETLTLDYMIHVNEIVARGEALQVGCLRNGSVTIGDLAPKIPTVDEVQQTIDALITSCVSDTQRALNTFTSFVRMQPFWDGNKRTAMLLANKDLITHGMQSPVSWTPPQRPPTHPQPTLAAAVERSPARMGLITESSPPPQRPAPVPRPPNRLPTAPKPLRNPALHHLHLQNHPNPRRKRPATVHRRWATLAL